MNKVELSSEKDGLRCEGGTSSGAWVPVLAGMLPKWQGMGPELQMCPPCSVTDRTPLGLRSLFLFLLVFSPLTLRKESI